MLYCLVSPFVRECGIEQIFAVGIWNPEDWNPESAMVWNPESTMVWNPESRKLESGIQRPGSGIQALMDSLTWGDQLLGCFSHPCISLLVVCIAVYHVILCLLLIGLAMHLLFSPHISTIPSLPRLECFPYTPWLECC